jgi:hypothetical protein
MAMLKRVSQVPISSIEVCMIAYIYKLSSRNTVSRHNASGRSAPAIRAAVPHGAADF